MLKLTAALIFPLVIGIGFHFSPAAGPSQASGDLLKNNSCVACHSQLTNPPELASRFLDWRASGHAAREVSCDKCHGGDPDSKDLNKAHRGVLPSSDSQSRLSASNVTQTCGSCHKAIAKSFVESVHYQRLINSGMGPSCTSCHGHMASSVRRSGPQGEELCTYCHNAVDGLLAPRPDIPADSKSTLDAIQRTEYVLGWIRDLINKADARHLHVSTEREQASEVAASIEGAKIAWHTFNVTGVKEMANKSYLQAVDIKERLLKRLAD